MLGDSSSIAKLSKEKGNVAFQGKDYITARLLYSYAIEIDPSVYAYPLNRAITNLKLERWHEAESDATTVLQLDPNNLKGLFRRGLARTELRQWTLARQDIQAFLECGGSPTEGLPALDRIADLESVSISGAQKTSDMTSVLSNAFKNLHLDNESSFTVRDSTSVPNGQGAFAAREFKRGDLILCERPLVSISDNAEGLGGVEAGVEAALHDLSPEDLIRFLSLHNAHTSCSCNLNVATGIFATNSFALGDDASGVCFHASRFNHSCAPNARHSFDPTTGDFRIHALGPISVGAEIFVTYSSGRNLYGTPRAVRQANLHARYHFTCVCAVCALPAAESNASDARRVRLTELWERIPYFAPTQVAERLRVIVEGVRTLKEEGFLADADDFTIEAGCVCAYHSDWASAKYWAGVTYQTRVDEFGEGSMRAKEVRKHFSNPRSMPMAGRGPPKDFSHIRLD